MTTANGKRNRFGLPWSSRSASEDMEKNCKSADGIETVSTMSNQSSVDSQGRPIRVFSSSYAGAEFTSPDSSSVTSSSRMNRRKQVRKLGTLNGVFLPCVQNILGVILFLRLTSITAQAGTVYTSLMIVTAVTSTFLTTLSLSAIATNGTIQAGGPYYVISRTLGIEIGGALGLLFYLGTTLASTMYVLGAIEALQRTVAWQFDARWASLILMWLVACVVSVGVRYVNMLSNVFLILVVVSIFCMTLGCILFASGSYLGLLEPSFRVFFDNLWPRYQPDPVTGITPTFFSLLSIFYPSVTGIMAGSNRSAVLADPARSIPNGTLGAIGFTTTLYLAVVWLFGLVIANEVLINDKFVVAAVAWPREEIVAVGVIFSSIGAALQTCAGAPRVLAAIAMDDALPLLSFVKPASATDEPTRAIWLTWLLASIPTMAGNLDHITPLITMFFLLMYAGINLSCFFLGVLKSPGFRPTFRFFHWSISLIGFLWCVGLVVLVITWDIALIVMIVFGLLYLYTKQQKASKNWGDVGNALRYAIATAALRALAGTQTTDFHAKNWRPQVLTVVDADDYGNPTHLHVLALARQLKQGGGGIHMVTSIMRRSTGLERYETCELIQNSRTLLQHHMTEYGLDECFAQVAATTTDTSQSILSAVVHSGLGPLSPNTVLLSYPTPNRSPRVMEDYIRILRGITNLKRAVVLFRGNSNYPIVPSGNTAASIDVWWVVHDGGLLLLLPYILSKNDVFQKSKLRLFAVTTSITENPDRLREAVIEHLARVRITATVQVVDLSDTTIAEDMREMDMTDPMAGSSLAEGNSTQHRTVGEVFSNETYEVPYHAVLEDLEMGDNSWEDSPPQNVIGSTPLMQRNNEKASIRHSMDERMRTCRAFNEALRHNSSQASLVVTNMPLIRSDKPPEDFFDYVDTMCESMQNVLLVRGSGVEVITTYA